MSTFESQEQAAPAALNRVSTVEALTTALRERILSGAEAPGTALREHDLCKAYGVSRGSLRAALQVLGHEGLVDHQPNRGAFVAQLDAANIRDVYRVRKALEGAAVRALAAGEASLGPVEDALNRLETLPAGASWPQVLVADLDFHQALVNALGSPRFARIFRSVKGEAQLCLIHVRADFEQDRGATVAEHAEILRALQRGDGHAAEELLDSHLDDALRRILAAAFSSDGT